MSGLNKVMLIGRLGNNPELRETTSGKSVCNFSLATSNKWKDKSGESQEKTEWHRIVAWGKVAEICHQYLSKGRQCYLEGSMQTRQWEDKEGIKRYTTEVVAVNVQFLGDRSEASEEPAQPTQQAQPSESSWTEDEIPF